MLSRKHDLDPVELAASLVAARKNGKSKCGGITVDLRDESADEAFYMFSLDGVPVAQAKIPDYTIEAFRRPSQENQSFITSRISARRNEAGDADDGENRIAGLRVGSKRINFKARVVKKSEVRAVTSRDGTPLLVCSATLNDGTGTIQMPLWNEQIASVREGDSVQIHDARIRLFRGQMQISLPHGSGNMTVLKTPAGKRR